MFPDGLQQVRQTDSLFDRRDFFLTRRNLELRRRPIRCAGWSQISEPR